MAYEINIKTVIELVEHIIKKAKKINGVLVVLNKTSDLADEITIEDIKDLEFLEIKNNDFLELTLYDKNDDDIFYEEFTIGIGKDSNLVKRKFIEEKKEEPQEKEVVESSKEAEIITKAHPFAKFIKKK